MFQKNRKQKNKEPSNADKVVVGGGFSRRFRLGRPGRKGKQTLLIMIVALLGLGAYAYWIFHVPTSPPAPQPAVPTTDGNDQITPPGTFRPVPVPDHIKHKKERPAFTG